MGEGDVLVNLARTILVAELVQPWSAEVKVALMEWVDWAQPSVWSCTLNI